MISVFSLLETTKNIPQADNLCIVTLSEHAPVSKHALVLEYRSTEINCSIYYTDTPAFSITVFSKCGGFFSAIDTCTTKCDYTVS